MVYIICPMNAQMRIVSKQYKPEMNLQYIYWKFLPTRYRVENPGKCWPKFDALPIVIKVMDKRVYHFFCFSSDIFGHQIKAKQRA